MKVSFDFDGTLTQPRIQRLAQLLIDNGIEVHILTYRYNIEHKRFYSIKGNHTDLYEISDKLGISRDNVVFTDYKDKDTFLKNTGMLFHLDDCPRQCSIIRNKTKVPVVDALHKDCVDLCLNLLTNRGITIKI